MGALASSTAGTQHVGHPQVLLVKVQQVGEGCHITLNGVHVTDDVLLQTARRERVRPAIITYGKDAPYRCVGAVIIILQEAGVMNIDTRPSVLK
jgi:hypothetical protein